MTRETTGRARLGRAIGVATTAILLGMMSPIAVMAEPKTLTESQMDSLTAAGIHIEVRAFASAFGRDAIARTRAFAATGITEERIDVGVGFAEGQAFACCGSESDVAVHSRASSSGDIVRSTTYDFELRGAAVTLDGEASYFAYGYTAAFLVALSLDDRLGTGQDSVSASRDDVAKLSESIQAPLQDGIVTGFELAPVLALGLRRRALELFLKATPLAIAR